MAIAVINLEGRWRGGRPTAHGSIINDSTFTVTFPDDNTITGTLEGPKTIRWSNCTVWTRVFVEV
jgi:hypothetical protein